MVPTAVLELVTGTLTVPKSGLTVRLVLMTVRVPGVRDSA